MSKQNTKRNPVLAAAMAIKGMNTKELSKATGMHPVSIGRILNRQAKPQPINAIKISQALDVSVADLKFEEYGPKKNL